MDNDGDINLAVTHYFSHNLYVLLNNNNGTFAVDSIYATGGLNSHKLCAGDFDGDGDLDLAVPNSGSANVAIMMNNGQATLSSPVVYPTGSFPYTAVTDDIDADGDLDLAVVNNGSLSVGVFLNNGTGVFAARVDYPVGNKGQSPALADFDKDGHLDLAVPNAHSSTPFVSVLRGKGDGTFHPKVDWPGCRPHTVSAADYDRDGNLDMAVADNECNSVSVFLGNGDATFQPRAAFNVGIGPNTTITSDFDGDGDLDLAVANFDNNGLPGNGVSILMNNTPVVSVQQITANLIPSFSLESNYPNPFNPITTIQFTISVKGGSGSGGHRSLFTTLQIYDLLGREVATLVNEELRPGSYEVAWDASEFPSGTYFYRLQAGGFVEAKKLTLVR